MMNFGNHYRLALLATCFVCAAHAADDVEEIAKRCDAGIYEDSTRAMRGMSFADGVGTSARFSAPEGLAITSAGDLIVADTLNRVIRKISREGMVSTIAGVPGQQGCADGPARTATFFRPVSVAVDDRDYIYVLDASTRRLRTISPEGQVSTLRSRRDGATLTNGTPRTLTSGTPFCIALDNSRNIVVASGPAIFEVTPSGEESVIAGDPILQRVESEASEDNPQTRKDNRASATLRSVRCVAVGPTGTLYVTEPSKVSSVSAAGVVRMLAGTGLVGRGKPTLTAPESRRLAGETFTDRVNPYTDLRGIAIDSNGDLLVAAGRASVVLKITPSGVASIVAGRVGVAGSVDGDRVTARLTSPAALVQSQDGTLFVADSGDSTIKRIGLDGGVTTIAGHPHDYTSDQMPLRPAGSSRSRVASSSTMR